MNLGVENSKNPIKRSEKNVHKREMANIHGTERPHQTNKREMKSLIELFEGGKKEEKLIKSHSINTYSVF